MVNLTRIYTRTGDDGTTALGDFSRTPKTDPRLVAYADVDETNAFIGVALASPGLPDELRTVLTRIQNDLFDVGADLCVPLAASYEHPPLRVKQEWIDELETACDQFLEPLSKLRSFVLNGGTPAAAHLHVARTVSRRAERSAWAAIHEYGTEPGTDDRPGGVNPLTAKYLNRLSDLLFIAARVCNDNGALDVLWQPGGGRDESATAEDPA